jgi:hypothetical protein
MNESLKVKYQSRLQRIPAPGTGCHVALLGVANLVIIAGLSEQRIFEDIRANVPSGARRLPDREISDAIKKAVFDKDKTVTEWRYKPAPIINDGTATLQKIIAQAKITDDAGLWESSPIKIDWLPEDDAVHFLSSMFEPSDSLFIGERLESGVGGLNIRTTAEWIKYFRAGGKAGPFIIVNSLTGKPAKKKSGAGVTYRGDACVSAFKFALGEFDILNVEDQIKFWSAVKLPIVALIDSGGKSVHAWLDVQKLAKIETSEQWETHIKRRLYEQILTPLGADGACSNPARLSRLPGHFRTEKTHGSGCCGYHLKDGQYVESA